MRPFPPEIASTKDCSDIGRQALVASAGYPRLQVDGTCQYAAYNYRIFSGHSGAPVRRYPLKVIRMEGERGLGTRGEE